MKYEEGFSSNRKKFGTGLIITIVVALIIVAGAAWFALSRYNSSDSVPDTMSDLRSDLGSTISEITSDFNSFVSDFTSEITSEYDDMTSSYNDLVSDVQSQNSTTHGTSQETNEGITSVPYDRTAYTMPVQGEILKGFSEKELQYSKTFGDMRLHSGIDIACKKGTSVSSCADGKVLTVEDSNHYGKIITIDHKNGITAKYCAIDDIKVKEGDTVKAGDIIGTVTTVPAECNDEEHLHFEVYKNGIAVSPLEALGLD